MPEVPPRFWRAVEAIHAVVYFAPDARASYDAIGLRGFWMGYFASRSAALGEASPDLVTALFFNFAPAMVRRALPDAWRRASPANVLVAREDLAVRTLAPLLPESLSETLVDGLETAVAGLDLAGRPLAAAQSGVGGSASPIARLWRAVTVLREYRGDGHVAALVAAGLDGAEANISHAASGALPPDQQSHRGWSDAEWGAAIGRLRARGWLDADARLTAEGTRRRADIERATDVAASRAFAGVAGRAALFDSVVRLASGPVKRGVPYPNAMGVLRP
ncbi:MAG TPA: hypothetical protein VHZ96_16665 [Frankiaceae bacterium]|nr:hypothetical protein [Frankiaceae bacterium]